MKQLCTCNFSDVAPLGSIQVRQADTARVGVLGKGCKHPDFIHAQWATVLKACVLTLFNPAGPAAEIVCSACADRRVCEPLLTRTLRLNYVPSLVKLARSKSS